MNRKILVSGLVLVLLLVGLGAGLLLVQRQQDIREKAAPASTLSILPPTKTVEEGEAFSLSVSINTAENVVTAAELYITYDKDKLTLESVTPGTFLPVELVRPAINNAAGTASMTFGAQPANPPQGSGVLATLNFKALSSGSARVGFGSQTQATGIDETTNVIVGMSSSNVLIAASAAPSPSPSPVVTPSPSPSPASEAAKPTISLPADKTLEPGDKITGTAKPGDTVSITIESHTITATATADSQGNWSYSLPQDLEPGEHTITVTDSTGSTTDTFTLASAGTTDTGSTSQETTSATTGTGGTTTTASPSPSPSLQDATADDLPVTATSWPTVVGLIGGVLMVLLGLALAF